MRIDRRGVIGGGLALAAGAVPVGWALAAQGAVFRNHIVLEDNRVWIAATLKKKPYLFIVDTGAYVSLIDDKFAKSIGLSPMQGHTVTGIGGVSDRSWYNAGEVTLASGIRFPDMLFAGMRAPPAPDAVGTFGAGLFTTYDSDLDFAKGEWRAYPGGRPNFDGLTRLKSRFTKGSGGASIITEVSVDGFTGDFFVDTGAPSMLGLDSRATAKSGLWDDARPYAPVESRGIGRGAVPGRLVRAGRMKVGPFVFERPLVKVDRPGEHSLGKDGLIGLRALGMLNLTTDISKGTLWAAPSGREQPETPYSASGVWLDDDSGRATIADVGTGSPAAAAGLKVGDVLVGEFRTLIRQLFGPPGRDLTVTVERAGARRDVTLKLAAYL